MRGETLLKPEILNRLLNSTGPQGLAEGPGEEIDLTDRELEVLQAVAQGRTSKEIAYKLMVTERTIKAHLSNIYTKLGVDSRAAAVSEAMYRGWLPGR